MALSSNLYAIKVRGLKKIMGHKAAPKVPEWPSYDNFGKVTQNQHFLKRCKGGPTEIFKKSPKTLTSIKAQKQSCANGIIL